MKKKTLSILLFVFSVLLIGAMVPSRIAITTSPSLDKRIFFVLKEAPIQGVEQGQYVMLDLRNTALSKEIWADVKGAAGEEKTARIVKRVTCRGGDILESRGNEYFCNGQHIGTAKDKTLSGRDTVKFKYNAAIPSGFLFVTGDHADSLDSKYFGLVPENKIEYVLVSIL